MIDDHARALAGPRSTSTTASTEGAVPGMDTRNRNVYRMLRAKPAKRPKAPPPSQIDGRLTPALRVGQGRCSLYKEDARSSGTAPNARRNAYRMRTPPLSLGPAGTPSCTARREQPDDSIYPNGASGDDEYYEHARGCETEVTLPVGGPWGGPPQIRAEGIGTWCGEYADEYEWAVWHMKHCLHETELCRSECYEFWQRE